MTCIIGLISKSDSCIYIAGDSAGVRGLDIVSRKDPKVFIRDEFAFGFTTSFRMGQILYSAPMDFESQLPDEDTYIYVLTKIVPWFRKIFKDGGFTNISENQEKGGDFIMAYNGKLFFVENSFQVAQWHSNFMACGCGASFALGALDILYSYPDMSDCDKIHKALEVAQKYSSGVRGPFNIVQLKF